MLLRELFDVLDKHAPSGLAYSWDNVGLQIGDLSRDVRRVLVCLDITPNAVNKAIQEKADLIVSHHPLIFNALKNITNPLILSIIEHRISVVSMHTNLDVSPSGVNHILCKALGFQPLEYLSSDTGSVWNRLVVSSPPSHTDQVSKAAFSQGAGKIGSYEDCSLKHQVLGTFTPGRKSNPFLGEHNKPEIVDEIELEFMVQDYQIADTIKAIKKAHPYETPYLYYHQVGNSNPAFGLGLICKPQEPMLLSDVVSRVVVSLGNQHPSVWNPTPDQDPIVEKIAICGGSGGSLVSKAERKADLYISGDINYHNLLECRIPIIDAGHFYTEYPVVSYMSNLLHEMGLAAIDLSMHEHEYYQNSIPRV